MKKIAILIVLMLVSVGFLSGCTEQTGTKTDDESNQLPENPQGGDSDEEEYNNYPTAYASSDISTGDVPFTVKFSGSGYDSDGSIVGYYWDFKDGYTSTEQNPSHTFYDPGTYYVKLTVTDNEGASGTDTVTIKAEVSNEVEIATGTYTSNGIKFEVDLDEKGDMISYKDKSGDTAYVGAQTGKKLLKFGITITSIDGENNFYTSNFELLDEDWNTYEPQCPVDYLGNCKNQDSLASMYDPLVGQKKSGILIFSIPDDTDKVSLIYKFSSYSDAPRVLKFVFTEI